MNAQQELLELERELEACHLHGLREYLDMADLLEQQGHPEAAARVRAQGQRYLEAHRCPAA